MNATLSIAPEEVKKRQELCDKCEHMNLMKMKLASVKVCKLCGCSIVLKTRFSKDGSCPDKRW